MRGQTPLHTQGRIHGALSLEGSNCQVVTNPDIFSAPSHASIATSPNNPPAEPSVQEE